MTTSSRALLLLATCACFAPIATPARAATFQGLGFLVDGVQSLVYDVAGDGSRVVGHSKDASDALTAFTWTEANGMAAFCCTAEQTIGRAVSSDGGVVIVSNGSSTGWMLWTPGTGLVPTGTGIASDLSGDGTVVAGSSGTAFRWTEATGAVDLGA